MFLGKLSDWGLRKARKEKILASLANAENKLKSLTPRQYEKEIACRIIYAYGYLQMADAKTREYSIWKDFLLPIVSLFIVGGAAALVLDEYNLNSYGVIAPYLVCYSASLILILLSAVSKRLSVYIPTIFRLLLISSVFSSTALILGSNLSDISSESDWFFVHENDNASAGAVLLTALNFPFDLATIVFSIFLLKFICEKDVSVILVAPLDVLSSLTLSLILYVSIVYFSGSEFPGFWLVISEGLNWLYLVVTDFSSLTGDRKMLAPLILTTTIPVLIYTFPLLLIAYVIKPLLIASGYLCGLLGEKKDTPFFEFATLISMILGLIKALQEWDRISNYLAG